MSELYVFLILKTQPGEVNEENILPLECQQGQKKKLHRTNNFKRKSIIEVAIPE